MSFNSFRLVWADLDVFYEFLQLILTVLQETSLMHLHGALDQVKVHSSRSIITFASFVEFSHFAAPKLSRNIQAMIFAHQATSFGV